MLVLAALLLPFQAVLGFFLTKISVHVAAFWVKKFLKVSPFSPHFSSKFFLQIDLTCDYFLLCETGRFKVASVYIYIAALSFTSFAHNKCNQAMIACA